VPGSSTSRQAALTARQGRHLRVLRIHQAGVVSAWRARDRELRARGVDVTLVSAARWNEGGRDVVCEPGADDFVVIARTIGSKPNLFVYDPRPLWRALRSGPFDLIDANQEPCSLATFEILCLRWAARVKVPLALYSAQNILKRYPLPFRWMERLALHAADGIHVCNVAAGDVLRQKGFTGLVEVVPLGVDIERFHPGAASTARPDSFSIGYVGRLDPHKGVEVLLDAVAGRPDWSVHVIGDGPSADELRRRAVQLGSQVAITGFLPVEDLPAAYRSFDVVVVPSLETPRWTEQFCRVAVEAMASGVPIVASASGALPEVIGDGGVFVPPGDVSALREALDGLAADPEERRVLGRAARDRSRRFAWSRVAESQHQFYAAIVE
jgi:glycosyltransferase involved in cell wall biosynthesis